MMIANDKYHEFRCPYLGGRNCLGKECAVWRAADNDHGYCGAGGPVMVIEPAPYRIQKSIVVSSPVVKMTRR